ncbi:MAG: response regulator [Candidatus Pacebacteria bacterium]|nr:response regulator [Candidatus Paceibacterota bacterium]
MGEQKKRILIVDDSVDLAEALGTALTHEGFEVHLRHTGESGYDMACTEKPDVILLDIEMPDITGIEVLKRLRKDAWGASVPVIIMSVLDDMQKIAEVVEEGGGAYVTKKDVNLFEIVNLVKEKAGIEDTA